MMRARVDYEDGGCPMSMFWFVIYNAPSVAEKYGKSTICPKLKYSILYQINDQIQYYM